MMAPISDIIQLVLKMVWIWKLAVDKRPTDRPIPADGDYESEKMIIGSVFGSRPLITKFTAAFKSHLLCQSIAWLPGIIRRFTASPAA